jgi:hypothetical protein
MLIIEHGDLLTSTISTRFWRKEKNIRGFDVQGIKVDGITMNN